MQSQLCQGGSPGSTWRMIARPLLLPRRSLLVVSGIRNHNSMPFTRRILLVRGFGAGCVYFAYFSVRSVTHTKTTTINTSDKDSPAHVTVNGFPQNKTIQTSSITPIRSLQTTSVTFRLGIEVISPLHYHRNRLHTGEPISPTTKQAQLRP